MISSHIKRRIGNPRWKGYFPTCLRCFSHPLSSAPALMHTAASSSAVRFLSTTPLLHNSEDLAEKNKKSTHDVFCPECGKRFFSAKNLENHRRSRHQMFIEATLSHEEVAARETNVEVKKLQTELRKLRRDIRTSKRQRQKEQEDALKKETNDKKDSSSKTPNPMLYAAALPSTPAAVVTTEVSQSWAAQPHRVGTNARWCAVGKVVGPVEYGVLQANCPAAMPDYETEGGPPGPPAVLQFSLEVRNHVGRALGQMKLTCAVVCVRYFLPQQENGTPVLYSVKEGDLLQVQGYYALHLSWDMVSKRAVENVVVEAEVIRVLHSDNTATSTASTEVKLEKKEEKPTPVKSKKTSRRKKGKKKLNKE
ncbi:hypothetical protein AGDE_14796 [Angomonas deanei]|uniref:C2H2-type domain-containing protein n=1 Tax=Angomonas deanei TaxID=59799 RepID=A0A7G2CQ44_9TRYP|nr:hypothetical protein AGDE_14796 [Angomonas deanei]CAD2221237.1 hypothetical protein, conserved [Angomonas deanei]|eukprot:EPY20202.1 hypothetical protein AGDE_14796 [Angomonas deanei]